MRKLVAMVASLAFAACGESTDPSLGDALVGSYRLTGFNRTGQPQFDLPALRSQSATGRTMITAGSLSFPTTTSVVIRETLQDYTATGTTPFRTREAYDSLNLKPGADGVVRVIDRFTPDTLGRIDQNANGPGLTYTSYVGSSLGGFYRFER